MHRHKSEQLDSDATELSGDIGIVEPDDDYIVKKRFSWWIVLLIILFSLSSWVAINGLWMELPLLVNVLPEGWNLPAYLSILIQIANVGPLIFVLLTRICNTLKTDRPGNCFRRLFQPPDRLANYGILVVGIIASLLLMKFWNAVVMIPGLPANAVYGGSATPEALYSHSLGLFILTFALGLIDCMSSVTFLAYLANMPPVYAGALLFGETTSGLLPSLYALVQGVTAKPTCVASKNANGTIEYRPVYSPPNFGVDIFMGLVAATTGVSLLAFLLLDCLPNGLGRSVTMAYLRHRSVPTDLANEEKIEESTETLKKGMSEKCVFWICFLLMGYASCLTNGLLPSLYSFSTAAYSSRTFHLAVTLSGITAPVVALLVTAVYGSDQLGLWIRSLFCCGRRRSSRNGDEKESAMASIKGGRLVVVLIAIGVLGTLLATYIAYLAKASPSPPHLAGAGPALAVLTWVLTTGSFHAQKTWLTLHLVQHGNQRTLRNLGVAEQVGASVGAFISFLITAKFKLFVSKPPCP